MLGFIKKMLAAILVCVLCIPCFAACSGGSESEGMSAEADLTDTDSASNSTEVADGSSAEVSAGSPEESEEKPAGPHDPITPLPEDDEIMTNSIDAYFDDSVFIGYSIMMHFGRYVNEWRDEVDESIMGGALFCAGVSMCFTTDRIQTPDMPDNSLPLYQGRSYNFADLPDATGANTLYIGLPGYSDLKRAANDYICVMSAYNEFVQGIDRIQKKNPDLEIVILSCTYNTEIYDGLTRERCTNAQVMEYNNLVLDYCNSEGIDFIDVSTVLTDRSGLLTEDYTSDGEYHIIKNAYYLWVEILRDYAARKQNGTWENIKAMPELPAV